MAFPGGYLHRYVSGNVRMWVVLSKEKILLKKAYYAKMIHSQHLFYVGLEASRTSAPLRKQREFCHGTCYLTLISLIGIIVF